MQFKLDGAVTPFQADPVQYTLAYHYSGIDLSVDLNNIDICTKWKNQSEYYGPTAFVSFIKIMLEIFLYYFKIQYTKLSN